MARLNRGAVWLVLVSLLGCSQIVDFDRSKINADAEVETREDGGGRPEGGTTRMDASVPMDALVEVDSGDAGLAVTCSSDDECGSNEICCENSCKESSPGGGCATCGGDACGDNSNTCNLRACSCGGGTPCTAPEPFCEQVPGGDVDDYRCVACRGDTDCPASNVCVDSVCRPCDSSKGNTGCENPTPICTLGQNTCVACDAANPCPSPLSCVGGSCFGCEDTTNAGCDAASTSPICDGVAAAGQAMRFQCEGCAADDECTGNRNGARCIATGACKACDPADTPAGGTNPACTGAASAYCDVGSNTCRACTGSDCSVAPNNLCAGTAGTIEPGIRGRCVECTLSTQCPLARPQCSATGACGGCTNDAACLVKGISLVCNNATGLCVDCTEDRDCPSGQQCNTATNACVDCTTNAGCSGGQRCNVATNTCVGCLVPNDCMGTMPICNAAGSCVSCSAASAPANACAQKSAQAPQCTTTGSCGVCNSATNAGCAVPTPLCNNAQTACVACTMTCADDNNACTGAPTCASNVCTYPVLPIVNDSNACTTDGCSPATGPTHVNACTGTTPVCRSAALGCAQCDPANNSIPELTNVNCTVPTPTCSASFTCVALPIVVPPVMP